LYSATLHHREIREPPPRACLKARQYGGGAVTTEPRHDTRTNTKSSRSNTTPNTSPITSKPKATTTANGLISTQICHHHNKTNPQSTGTKHKNAKRPRTQNKLGSSNKSKTLPQLTGENETVVKQQSTKIQNMNKKRREHVLPTNCHRKNNER
jgi:hypothetical protein